MDLEWAVVVRAILSLGVGALVQASLGFGMGMVATPLLVWDGLTLPQAIGILVPNIFAQSAVSCWTFRQDLPWRLTWQMCVYRYLGLPIGILVLAIVAEQGQAVSRAVLGVGILVALILQQFQASRPSVPTGRVAMALAGWFSGFLAGLIGMGGPPLVLWVMRQNWPGRIQRLFLWLSFVQVMPLQLAMMSAKFGTPWLHAVGVGLVAVPLTLLVSTLVGQWADRWSQERLRFGMRLFLLVIAIRLVAQLVG